MERGSLSVVTDPYQEGLGLEIPRLKGDVVTISHNAPGHNNVEAVKGVAYTLSGAGEYEIGGVFLSGVAMHLIEGDHVRPNVAYLFEYSGLTVLHLGDLAHVPDQSTIENFGEVHVVLVPVGGGNGLRAASAAEVIALIEPNYIVPMHYAMPGLNLELDSVDKFTKAMGVSKVQEQDMLRVTSGSLPEQPQIVLLTPQTQTLED